MTEKDIFRAELDRLKDETSIGLSEWENGVEHGRMEVINALYKTLDSMQKECKPKYFNVEKGKLYICIRGYHDKNCTFTKGKTYQSDMDGFLVDDEDKCTFERKIWEEDACEYFRPAMQEEPKKCMYSKDNYTDNDRKTLCDGCEEKCEYEQQMMANAVDGTARPDDSEIWCNLASSNLKDGDKVKLIIFKED